MLHHSISRSRIGILLLASIVWFEPVSSRCAAKDSPPGIVNFNPTTFDATASAPFFYSIGGELKFSDSIDPDAPTIFQGKIRGFQVSPDGKRIVFVSDHKLLVVDHQGKTQTIGNVDSIFRTLKPMGSSFVRDEDFQWSPDSMSVYFIRDKFYRSKGAQLFSEYGELWMFEVETGDQRLVIKPFRAFQIIFGRGTEIYFAVPLADGSLELELFNGNTVRDFAASKSGLGFPEELSRLAKDPFYSFSTVDYMNKVLPGLHLLQDFDSKDGLQKLNFGDRTLLELTRSYSFWDGWGDCDEMLGSTFLPGGRFFLLNVPYCRNYKGHLLIDIQTGSYKTLPKDTRVFITANTKTYPHYRFNHEGIEPE